MLIKIFRIFSIIMDLCKRMINVIYVLIIYICNSKVIERCIFRDIYVCI